MLAAAAPADAPPRVPVTGGVVQGSAVQGAVVFRGIPFAAPPTGSLRWRAPAPVAPWQGVRADDPDAPACLRTTIAGTTAITLRSAEELPHARSAHARAGGESGR